MTWSAHPALRLLSLLLMLALACAALATGNAAAQASTSQPSTLQPSTSQPSTATISPAETLLFETDHLARVKPPAVLVYDFRKVSNVEPGFSDKVQLDLAAGNGKTSATLHFLSGVHKHDTPALDDAHGNPVLLGFLERDIAEMKRLTGGSTAYFRKRIRMALADNANVSTQTITYDGKSLPAQVVRIQPYLNDPMHARFEPYVHKTYTFIVSDGVPGGVYQLKSSLANGNGMTVAGAATAKVAGAAGTGVSASVSASPGGPAAGAVPGGAASGGAASGKAVASTTVPVSAAAAPAAASVTAAHPAAAAGNAALPSAAPRTAAAGVAAAGSPAVAGVGKALPAIDETLTLVSVAHPKR